MIMFIELDGIILSSFFYYYYYSYIKDKTIERDMINNNENRKESQMSYQEKKKTMKQTL